jgi:hypothetical protein
MSYRNTLVKEQLMSFLRVMKTKINAFITEKYRRRIRGD